MSAAARSRRRFILLVLVGLVATIAVGAVDAGPVAADVVVGPVQPVAGAAGLSGVACQDATDCLAVGTDPTFDEALMVPLANGLAGTPVALTGSPSISSVASPDAADCLAGGTVTIAGTTNVAGGFVPIDAAQPGSPQAGSLVPATGAASISALACPDLDDCVGIGDTNANGQVVDVVDGSPAPPQDVSGTVFLDAVACSSPSTCLAAGNDGASGGVVVPITAGSPGPVEPPITNVSQLSGIACASATVCYAVGRDAAAGDGDGVVVPITGGTAGAAEVVLGTSALTAVACSSSTTCVAVGRIDQAENPDGEPGYVVVPITDGIVGPPVELDGFSTLSGVACSSAGECVAVGETAAPGGDSQLGAVVQILISGSLGQPTATIGAPGPAQTFPLNAPTAPTFAFTCQPAFAGMLATPGGGCTATVDGRVVTNGQAIDTSHAGTFTPTVTATQADGQQTQATDPFTIAKGVDSIFFPQIGPFPYRHAAVTLGAIAASELPLLYTVVSGACTVSGATLIFTGSGPCVVEADQPGNTNYGGASETSTISVEPPTPPVCAGLSLDVASGQAAAISLGCADAPADDGDPLSYAVASIPEHGILTGLDGATGAVTYTPTGDYAGPDSFTFDATDAQGVSGAATISIVVATPPERIAAPLVSGTAALGHSLACSRGTWSGTAPLSYAYQWKRRGIAVAGRTGTRYVVGAADLGRSLTCAVTATNAVGSVAAQSPAFAIPLPSSAFRFGKFAASPGGTLAIELIAPGPGRFEAAASYALVRHRRRTSRLPRGATEPARREPPEPAP